MSWQIAPDVPFGLTTYNEERREAPVLALPWEMERRIARFVEYQNRQRYRDSLDNLTPAEIHFVRAKDVLTRREVINHRMLHLRRLHCLQTPQV